MSITLEKDGRKATRKFSYSENVRPEAVIAELETLITLPTADPAESIPKIDDALTEDVSRFTSEDMATWAKTQYQVTKKDLEATIAKNPFHLGIESLIVSGSYESTLFMNSYGSEKKSTTSHASYQVAIHGNADGVSDSEWYYRDSSSLLPYDAAWTEDCVKKLSDKLRHARAGFGAGTYPIAFAPDLAADLVGEFLGFLSGYAISEQMSPYAIDDM